MKPCMVDQVHFKILNRSSSKRNSSRRKVVKQINITPCKARSHLCRPSFSPMPLGQNPLSRNRKTLQMMHMEYRLLLLGRRRITMKEEKLLAIMNTQSMQSCKWTQWENIRELNPINNFSLQIITGNSLYSKHIMESFQKEHIKETRIVQAKGHCNQQKGLHLFNLKIIFIRHLRLKGRQMVPTMLRISKVVHLT